MVEDFQYSGHRPRVAQIHGHDPSFGDRTGHQKRVGRILDDKIRSVASLAGYLEAAVQPRFGIAHVVQGGWCSSGHRQISMAAVSRNARTSVRLPSSILKKLSVRPIASLNATSAA